jgi:hypothetical protein
MKDIDVLKNACKTLGINCLEKSYVDFFDGKRVHGTKVILPNWRYPVCVTNNGEIIYDNYEGNWGDIKELNALKQRYAVEKTKLVAKRNGYTFTEKKVGNDIKLFVNV